MLSHVMPADAIVNIRKYVSALSLMSLRSTLLRLLEFITNLGSLPLHYLAVDAPSLVLLQSAVLDLIYGSLRRRSGNSLYVSIFSYFSFFLTHL